MILYFPHIPKTGGQTLVQGFMNVFGADACVFVWPRKFDGCLKLEDYAKTDLSRFPKKWFWKRPLQKVLPVAGHLPVRNFLENSYACEQHRKARVVYVSVVRDPIERIVSNYNYVRYNKKHPYHDEISGVALNDYLPTLTPNKQFEFLQFDDECSVSDVIDRLELFPIKHSVDGFNRVFRRCLGESLGDLSIRNASQSFAGDRPLFTVDDIAPDLLVELEEKHSLDRELYQAACDRWDRASEISR